MDDGTWPFMASIHGGPGQKFFCGGSLIAPNWLITAGHCIGGYVSIQIFIVLLNLGLCKIFYIDCMM